MYPPTQIDKNGVFYAIGHNETSGVSECFFVTFSKMTKMHSFHFNFNFTKTQKSNFVFAKIFDKLALRNYPILKLPLRNTMFCEKPHFHET